MDGSKNKILSSSLKMASATFISRILGLVREQSIAAIFGASAITDAFWVAYRIPNLLRDLFAEGAFSAAFVPTFTEVYQLDRAQARKLLWSLFILLFAVTSFVTILIIIFAGNIVTLFAPSFVLDAEKFRLTVLLVRVMAPFLIFISIAALFMGALNTCRVFLLPALAPALFNVVMIAAICFLPQVCNDYGYPAALALGIGVVVGGFFQALMQLYPLIKRGLGPTPVSTLISSYSKKILKLMSVGLVGMSATQLNLLVNTILASSTVGAVSWLSYAFRLFQFPVGILSVSIANSNLVYFSNSWKKGEREQANTYLQTSYVLALLSTLPALAVMFSLSDTIVYLVFQRGKFGELDTHMTSLALRCYALGLPFYGLYKILAPTFYAVDKQNIPIAVSVLAVLFNIIFCVLLVPHYGFKILAMGTSISMLLNVAAQALLLRKIVGLPKKFFINSRVFKIVFAAIISFGACYIVNYQLGYFFQNFVGRSLFFIATVTLSLAVYILVIVLMGEAKLLKDLRK